MKGENFKKKCHNAIFPSLRTGDQWPLSKGDSSYGMVASAFLFSLLFVFLFSP